MKVLQFVETTKERYDDHVIKVRDPSIYGGRYSISEYDDDQVYTVRTYHNESISDIGHLNDNDPTGHEIPCQHAKKAYGIPYVLQSVEQGDHIKLPIPKLGNVLHEC